MTRWFGLAALLALLPAVAAGCGSDESSGGTAPAPAKTCGPLELPKASGTTPPRAKVDTIFATSCSFQTCHGIAPGSGQLHLPKMADGDWYPNVVMRASSTHKTMPRVTPGDPANSFLVHKVSGYSLCTLTAGCDQGNCGGRMPEGGDALAAEDLATLVDWIRGGAPAM